jgi:hypothetical protein
MLKSFYTTVRDLHLYFGLFISPFVVVFSLSVFFLVHAWLPQARSGNSAPRVVADLTLPADLKTLSGRARIDALQTVLPGIGVHGEVGWVQHNAKQNQLVFPVTVPGRETMVTLDMSKREAAIAPRNTGWADALVALHKAPGPHLAGMRMNWIYMRIWGWLADATVYLLLFISVSGIYLWYVIRAERRAGLILAAAGAISFFGLVYALAY